MAERKLTCKLEDKLLLLYILNLDRICFRNHLLVVIIVMGGGVDLKVVGPADCKYNSVSR